MLALVLAIASPAGASDSLRALRRAHDLQAAFELTRRSLLPVSTSGSGRCDERVGRFCYWYDPDEPPPPAEPAAIKRARGEMLRGLATIADSVPGDDWVLAQRVRYMVEQGETDSAAALAGRCETWWCDALAGFAFHVKGEVAGAEAAFAHALAKMPPTLRCQWNDLSRALGPTDLGAYHKLQCLDRDSANARLFWRATPAFARGGNDVRTAWYSRQTLARAMEGAVTHHGIRIGSDYREMMFRYGWATAYGRRPEQLGADPGQVEVVGHEPKPAYPFLAFDPESRWPPEDLHPRARFSPGFASRIIPLDDLQLARFRRGDSIVVVAAFTAHGDTAFLGDAVDAELAASAGPDSGVARSRSTAPRGAGTLRLETRAGVILSVEVRDSSTRAWAVHRGLLDTLAVGLSDLLMTVPGESLPATLEEAERVAWRGSRVEQGATVGLYWERYGETDSLENVTLTVEAAAPGFLTRMGQSLGITRRGPPLKLAWTPHAGIEGFMTGYSVEVDLSRLSPGRYVIVVDLGRGRKAERPVEIMRVNRAT